jgi:hypothetical protein
MGLLCLSVFCVWCLAVNYNANSPPDPAFSTQFILQNVTQLVNSTAYDSTTQSWVFVNITTLQNVSELVFDPLIDSSVLLDRLSLGNVPNESPLMWLHVIFAFMFTFLTLKYIQQEYEEWLRLRKPPPLSSLSPPSHLPPAPPPPPLLCVRFEMHCLIFNFAVLLQVINGS